MQSLSFRIITGAIIRPIVLLMLVSLPVNIARAQPYGLSTRPLVGAFLNGNLPPASQSAVGWQVVQAFPNLTFDDPITLVAEPRTNRLYVCERQGKIFFFQNNPATTGKTLFLDLTAATQGYDDCGVMGIAFHPQYGVAGSTNRGYVYVYYQFSENPSSGPNRPPSATPGFNRLSRFTVPNGSLVADRASELVMINQYDRHVWHNGGGMLFGPDGFLYLSNGDEGAANDSYSQSQEINSGLFSGVLRIDVDQDPTRSHPIRRQPVSDQSPPGGWTNVTFSAHYFIPNDNPWLDPGGSILEEFYAIGLRSPHRMTYDPPSGRIWLGDVGQGTREEVDIIEKGRNYQWAFREGSINGPKATPNPIIGISTPPVYDYGRSAGDTCVIGGYVYRGLEHADTLYGKYIFGDNTSGRVWTMTYDGTNAPTVVELLDTGWANNYSGLSGFGVDHNNELYLCKMGRPSTIYKLARTGSQPPPPPPLLSQIGAFTNLTTLAPMSGLIPYDVNSPLWSDGTAKARWVAIPSDGAPYGPDETVGFAATGEWTFPIGTVFVKHFELGVNETNPATIKRLETRFLVHATNDTYYGLTYKWRADHSDADLLPGGLLEDIPIQTASNIRTQIWQYPSRDDCLTCHNATANRVLGVKTRQLNGDLLYPATGVTDNQLRTWNHIGVFDTTLAEANIPAYDKLVAVTNESASLELRVRSYLDANCAHCHRPNGSPALFDARFDTPLESQGLVNGSLVDPMGIAGAKVVRPQSPGQSILHLRDSTVGPAQMPPLAKNVVDTNYISVLAQWINSLPLPVGLPSPWEHQDVGNMAFAGDANYSIGAFTVDASGADIWNAADGFHFVHRPLNGDGIIVARVDAVENTNPWAKAGVMIRESLTAGSTHAFMAITPGNGAAFQRRTATGGASTHTAGTSVTAPYWVRLVRSGNTFTGYQSVDGQSWSLVGSESISMSAVVNVGLAVTSHDNSQLCTATFSQVLLTGPNVNSPPTITSITDQSIAEDTAAGPIGFTVGDAETSAASLTLMATSSNPALLPVSNITFGGGAENRSVTLTPLPDQSGSSDVTITVSDGSLNALANFELTVTPVNDPPVAGTDVVTRWKNQGVKVLRSVLLANDTDVEGDPLAVSAAAATSTAGAAVTLGEGWIYYLPPDGFHNNDDFTYTVADGHGGLTTNGVVQVQLAVADAATSNIDVASLGDGTFRIRAQGIPGRDYQIQYRELPVTPAWQTLVTLPADQTGVIEYVDEPSTNAFPRDYRTTAP